jgi:hypothetical protein
VRDSTISSRSPASHCGGGGGPGVLLATTLEVSTLSERRRQMATFEWDTLPTFTNRAYFEHL